MATVETDHLSVSSLNHLQQTPLTRDDLQRTLLELAETAIALCHPNGEKYYRKILGEPGEEIASVDIFKLHRSPIPATVEISTEDTNARTAVDPEGNLHVIVAKKGGPHLNDSTQARDAFNKVLKEVFAPSQK